MNQDDDPYAIDVDDDAEPCVAPHARAWAAEQRPVCLLDFQPQCYSAMDDRIRVQRIGVLWYGEVRSHLSPLWYVVTEHHRTFEGCILATLKALGMGHLTSEHDCSKDHEEESF